MRDRKITKDEINRITEKCQTREKAFFTVMRQSGLPPHTIKQLKIKNLERILEPDPPIPCKIKEGKFKSLPHFIGGEAVKYLKQYLKTRKSLTSESLLFSSYNNPNKEINTKDVSRAFRLATQKLEITYEVKKGEPNELRLFSLVKFYRKNAKDYLTELNNNSAPRDDESYKKLYEDKARPNLEIEQPTPIQIQQLEREYRQLREQLTKIQNRMLLPVTGLYHTLLGTIPENVLSELKPDIPLKNEEDREQRIQKALHKLIEQAREEESKQTNNHDVPSKNATRKLSS